MLAGYKDEMDRMIANANPGLRSRFKEVLTFQDWTERDVVAAIEQRAEREGYARAPGALARLEAELRLVRARPGWANARDANTAFEFVEGARAMRVADAPEDAPTITADDVADAMAKLKEQRPAPPGAFPECGGRVETVHTMAEFEAVLRSAESSNAVVVADFYATWCPPCARAAPKFAQWSEELDGCVFIKIDVDGAVDIARSEQISSMPTFKLYKAGAPVQTIQGFDEGQEAQVLAAIHEHARAPTRTKTRTGPQPPSAAVPDGPRLPPPPPEQRVRQRQAEASAKSGGGDGDETPSLERALGSAGFDVQTTVEILSKPDEDDAFKGLVESEVMITGWESGPCKGALKAQCSKLLPRFEELAAQLQKKRSAKEQKEYDKAQEILKQIGKCCAGFEWLKEGSGWRCAGGSHTVSGEEMRKAMLT